MENQVSTLVFKITDLVGDSKNKYDSLMKSIPKSPDGKIISPSPIGLGYKIIEGNLIINIGVDKFNTTQNKHLYLVISIVFALKKDELEIINKLKTPESTKKLLDLTKDAWDEATNVYNEKVKNTVFSEIPFVLFNDKVAEKTISGLQKL